MKVVHISSYDCNGGAARAAYRLHQGLRRLGLDSQMFVANKDSDDPSVLTYAPSVDFKPRISRVWRRRTIARDINRYRRVAPGISNFGSDRGNFSDDRSQYGSDPWKKVPEADLMHIHWVAGFLDYETFFASVPPDTPIIWTLHDMVAFTGGCHWDHGCGKFAQQCGACPQLSSSSRLDLTRQVWQRKQKSYHQLQPAQLHIVTPSQWLRNEVKRSSLLPGFPSSVIPYGLDTEIFAPRDRRVAREILRIPLGAKVVLFLADGVHIPRKGFQLLTQALAGLAPESNMLLLSMGGGEQPRFQGLRHMHISHLSNDGILSCVYSAADVFVAPSLEDNLPNTILEAMACGVPVAGFSVGGIPDAVRPGVTGLLAPKGDAPQLRRIISELLIDEEKRAEMGASCRRIALLEYSLEVQARRYLELYQELLGKDAPEHRRN